MIQLRPYQADGIRQIHEAFLAGKRRPLFTLPTGGGKTQMFTYITTSTIGRGKRVAIVAHRDELLRQIGAALSGWGCSYATLRGGMTHTPQNDVLVAGVQTLARRLDRLKPFDLIISDEAHHATNATAYGKIMAAWPNAYALGVTATPERLDGRGLGECFDALIVGPSVRELIDGNYLVPPVVYAPRVAISLDGVGVRGGDFEREKLATVVDKPRLTGDAISHYRRLAAGKPAVAFCVSVRHAHHVAAEFIAAGFRAVAVEGASTSEERLAALSGLADGSVQVVCAADLISEGVDVPALEVVIGLRPTKSLGLYMQQVGRSLRPAPGKTEAIILDHSGNSQRHGLPDEPREWSLSGEARRKRASDASVTLRTCTQCFAVHRPAPACPRCGYRYEVVGRLIESAEGELERVDPAVVAHHRKIEVGMAKTLEELQAIARQRGYKSGWAYRVWQYKQQKRRA